MSALDQVTIDERAVRDVLVRFAGTLVKHYVLDDVMDRLGQDIRAIVDVAGAGIMLRDDAGNLRFTSTSDARLAALESLQIELGEGPCLLACEEGRVVIARDLRADDRFPLFGPKAVAAGMAAVYSFPMAIDGQIIGAANLYRDEPGELDAAQIEIGQTLAHVATTYLLHARDLEQRELITSQLQQALNSRAVIEQAKGFVAHALGCTVTEAFELIRRYARNHQAKVRVASERLIAGELSVRDVALG